MMRRGMALRVRGAARRGVAQRGATRRGAMVRSRVSEAGRLPRGELLGDVDLTGLEKIDT
eukprot:NODE_10169_length_315_cov_81.403846.p3 GENE.NODE_10169_length_315_cov_81.403846~~NODE_10169_length_315_cov_81.403846.p3  ORF type:complete len:60 (+),score=11.17 NODE_10169_length_315_cov_81.403846:35-214(+)